MIIHDFGGLIPRLPWNRLPENSATIAHDVKLRNGKLEAWRERESIGYGVADAISLVSKGCCLLTYDTCVSVADYIVDYGRMFITGREDRPETFTMENCQPTYYYLGVPAPATPPTVEAEQEQDGRDCSARSYVYTFVNVFGEESAPSPASIQVTVQDGTNVLVEGFETPPAGYGIEAIKIYRTATGDRTGAEKEQQSLTIHVLVGIIFLDETEYVDEVLERNTGAALTTRENRIPPQYLRQIRYVSGTGTLVGVTNNQVHFSANMQPANWPAEHDITLPYNIVNMVVVNGQAIVSTDGYPYVVDATPNCEPRRCKNVTGVDTPLPDIGCGYPNSAIATPFGMIYSSKDGLVLVIPDGQFRIITSDYFSTENWIAIKPDTVRLAYWRGYLICVTDAISFMLEIDGDTYGDTKMGRLVTISDTPQDMVVTSTGELLMLEDRFIYQWNAGSTRRPYQWESNEFTFNGKNTPTSAKVRTNDITFRLLTPKPGLFYERKVLNETPFRLRRLGRHYYYRVGFYGTGTVDFVKIGTSFLTVNQGA